MYFLYYKYMATKFLNRYGDALNEINYDTTQYLTTTGTAAAATKLATARTISLGGDCSGSASFNGTTNITINTTVKDDSHNHTIANIDNLQNTLNGKLSTSAAAASAKEMYNHVHLTDPDSANNTNFRLIHTHSIDTWNNFRGIFIVKSRHNGCGLLSIAFGCNNGTVNAANCYGEICYYGPHASSSGTPIETNSWQIYVSSDGKKMYIIWKIYDYSDTYLYKLASDFNLENGTSLGTSIPSSYGSRKCQTTICYGENSSYNSRITTLENWMNKYNSMLNIIGNNA